MTAKVTSSRIGKRYFKAMSIKGSHAESNSAPMDSFWHPAMLRERCGFGIGRRARIIERLRLTIWYALISTGTPRILLKWFHAVGTAP
jgi:hypothetical protein